jgi:signal peptidase I
MSRLERWLDRRVPAASRQAVLLAILLFGSIGCYLLISHWVFGYVRVQGASMTPTLREGDAYLLHKWELRVRNPRRGDIVAIRDPLDDQLSVKRVVGMPGDVVEFRAGRLFVGDVELAEPYLGPAVRTYPTRPDLRRIRLAEDEYLVLGDNRSLSLDGRVYGGIPRDRIVGALHK